MAGAMKVTLSWSAPRSNGGSTITGYWVYEGTSAVHISAKPLNATAVTSLTYTARSLKKGTTYYFEIRAINAAGISPSSLAVSAKVK